MVETKEKLFVCRRGHVDNYYEFRGNRNCRDCDKLRGEKWRAKNPGRSSDLERFGGNREKAIVIDGEKCVDCGMTREKHFKKYKKDISVDHIDNQGLGVKRSERNNNLNNLQTLCLRCHGIKDGFRIVEEIEHE